MTRRCFIKVPILSTAWITLLCQRDDVVGEHHVCASHLEPPVPVPAVIVGGGPSRDRPSAHVEPLDERGPWMPRAEGGRWETRPVPEATTDRELTPAEVRSLARAFRRPVGRYTYERASHLAGVPQRTLHHWAREGIFVPDFDHARPKQWSYRDLVLVRLFVWLRHAGQKPDSASRRVAIVRQLWSKPRRRPSPSCTETARCFLSAMTTSTA